jgi:hypothetical protein
MTAATAKADRLPEGWHPDALLTSSPLGLGEGRHISPPPPVIRLGDLLPLES